jgi:hypothetical protein
LDRSFSRIKVVPKQSPRKVAVGEECQPEPALCW